MYPIKQSTALTVPFFVHDAAGDAVTGLTNASFTKRISKGSGAYAAMTVTITEMENGWYSFPLSTTHSNTLGLLSVVFTNAGAKQVNLQFRVNARLPDDMAWPTTSGRSIDVLATGEVGLDLGNVSGALTNADVGWVDGSDRVDVGAVLGTAQTAGDIPALIVALNDLDAAGIRAAVGLAAANLDTQLGNIPTVAEFNARTLLAASYFDPAANTVANVTTVATLTGHIAQTGDTFAKLAGITLLAEWLGAMAGKQVSDATAQTEMRASGAGSGSYLATSDSLEAIRDTAPMGSAMRGTDGVDTAAMRGTDAAALASIATEVRLAELDAGNLPADVDTLLGRITATVFSGITSLAEWLGLLGGKQVGDVTARTELRATGAGAGTFDETADSQEAIRDTPPLGTAMRGTDAGALASVATESRLAELDPANLPADVAAVKAETVLILADTNELQGDWVDGGRLDLQLDDIISKLPAATVDGLTPTQLWATVLASCAGRIVDKTVSPMVIQNPDGTQTRISVTTDRGAVTLSFTGV